MRNICTVDFSNAENVGVSSSISDGNELILIVIPYDSSQESEVSFSVEKSDDTLASSSSPVEYGSAKIVIPFSWYSTAGTLTLTDPYHNDRQVIFNITETLASNSNVQIRYSGSGRTFNVIALPEDLPLASDYVIEDGQNTLWAWRKWKNGKMEAWRIGSNQHTTSFPSTFGNLHYAGAYSYSTTGDASQFVSVEDVQMTMRGGGIVWESVITANVNAQTGVVSVGFYIASATQGTSYTITVSLKITGRWK